MQNINFSPTEAIGFGWKKFKENKKFWIISAFLVFMLSNGGGSFNSSRNSSSDNKSENPTTQEQNFQYNTTSQYDILPQEQLQKEDESLPLIPKQIDEVLGISDQRDNGNTMMFVILFVVALVIFLIPFFIASALVSGAVQMGIQKFFLSAVRGSDTKYELILSEVKLQKSFRFLSVSFLYTLLVLFGLIFFIIPGIYFGTKYMFVTYAIVDRDAKIGEAFSLSGKWTKGAKWKLLGLGILVILVNLLGVLALIYGLLVTVPVTMIASAYAYDRLSKSS